MHTIGVGRPMEAHRHTQIVVLGGHLLPTIRSRNERTKMTNYDQFHDGSLDGILIEQASVHVFISTEAKEPFVLTVRGVVALAADGFKAGNIIFEVLTKHDAEITLQDMTDVYGLAVADGTQEQAQKLLDKARERGLSVLEINPSYGASCIILAESVDFLRREEWADRAFASVAR